MNKKIKIFFDIHHSYVIVFYMQILKIKYNKGIQLFNAHKRANKGSVNVVSLKSDLRRLGYSNKEIDSFFASTSELKSILKCHEYEQRIIHQTGIDFSEYYEDEKEQRVSDELAKDPFASYEDEYEIQFDIQ